MGAHFAFGREGGDAARQTETRQGSVLNTLSTFIKTEKPLPNTAATSKIRL